MGRFGSSASVARPVQSLGKQMTAIITLTRFPEIFECLRLSVGLYEKDTRKIVVTSGGCEIDAPGWETIEGSEPFVFARNVNLGFAATEGEDVLLVNDDCVLLSPVTQELSRIANENKAGLLSPQIVGDVGNILQRKGASNREFYLSGERLAFVCIWIPWSTRKIVGKMDERFTGYGGDDDDYSLRTQKAGLHLGVTSKVVVKHGHGKHGSSSSFYKVMTPVERSDSMAEMLKILREKHHR